MNRQPPWLIEADTYLGIRGVSDNSRDPRHHEFWRLIKYNAISNDEIPWAAAFVGAILESVGVRSTKSGLSRSYLRWGKATMAPNLGSIVVFSRRNSGHIGFAVGRDHRNGIYVLGANQRDAVTVELFRSKNIVGYRWPNCQVRQYALPCFEEDK
jgi:uncharacterized protein (TIGR02594 family)